MSRIEIRPFRGLEPLEEYLSEHVVFVQGTRALRSQRIELSARLRDEPGTIQVEGIASLKDLAIKCGYELDAVSLQASTRKRSIRLRSPLGAPISLNTITADSVEFEVSPDPNGQEISIEVVLSSAAVHVNPEVASNKHTWLARCVVNLVADREPNTFPRKLLTDEVRRRLKLPNRSGYYVEISDLLLGESFESSVTVWIDEVLGELLDQKESSSASEFISRTIAIDTTIAIGVAAWREASGNDESGITSFDANLLCTQWLASKWSAANKLSRARNEAQLTSYAQQFAQGCAETPEYIKAKLQHAWDELKYAHKTLLEAQA